MTIDNYEIVDKSNARLTLTETKITKTDVTDNDLARRKKEIEDRRAKDLIELNIIKEVIAELGKL